MSARRLRKKTGDFTFSRVGLAVLAIAVLAIYGPFLRNPLVFDDGDVFKAQMHREYWDAFIHFHLRWLPYATFKWTQLIAGPDLIWQRLGNVLLHLANGMAVFAFVHRLFRICLPVAPNAGLGITSSGPSVLGWYAFAGAALFLLHPAAVYGVAYLVQRTILMATFFSIVMWWLFLEGSTRKNLWLLWASVPCYALAVLSKEHAVMAPAIAAMLLVLVADKSRPALKTYLPIFVAYVFIAAFVATKLGQRQVIGEVYEPRGQNLLSALASTHSGFDPSLAHPLSIVTQSFLFFKYLLIWIAPNPLWMSADMVEPIALKLFAWPHTAGLLGFLVYIVVALRWLFRGGGWGLAGFAILSPALLFMPEFSTVRIQEPFVLYRSYLWMVLPVACMPLLLLRVEPRRAAALLAALLLVILPVTWNRLTSFSNELLLWHDAARLIRSKGNYPGVERIYLNRGIAFYEHGRPKEAIQDLNRALEITPWNVDALTSRGAALLVMKRTDEALRDFDLVVRLTPAYERPYLGKGLAHELRGEIELARASYQAGCRLGSADACNEAKRIGREQGTVR
ncbi:MAG: tetratricopeptide repeat protein [Burkholderiaceae bacterium]